MLSTRVLVGRGCPTNFPGMNPAAGSPGRCARLAPAAQILSALRSFPSKIAEKLRQRGGVGRRAIELRTDWSCKGQRGEQPRIPFQSSSDLSLRYPPRPYRRRRVPTVEMGPDLRRDGEAGYVPNFCFRNIRGDGIFNHNAGSAVNSVYF